ncbi:MAG: TonB-dependent receptor [Bacteroidales bacterium]|nr:TonB-dependent receptor [Bacteroidales bacterium]
MKKLYFSFVFFLLIAISLPAQQSPDVLKIGKVSGQIIDAQTNEPLEYATIAILRERDSTLVTGTITDRSGNFRITDIPVGKYYAKIDFLGYKTLLKSGLTITVDNPEVKLRKIPIEPSASALEIVNIVADKPLYQNQIDRKVINPDKDIMSAGGTALNVLESAPSVDVDVEGNVSLRGNTSVTILIDGRPSGYSGESAGDLLQQIPANAIDRVEVLTNPSSKYNPEGITGIINIVMKKNSYGGFNGSVNAGIGTLLDYGAGANLNYRNDKINFYSNFGLNNRKMEMTGENNRQTFNHGDTTTYLQNSKNNMEGTNLSARAGIDFFLNQKNTFTLTGNVSGNPNPRKSEQRSEYEISNNSGDILNYNTKSNDENSRFSYNAGALWETTFTNKNHFLLFDASFGKRQNDGNSKYDVYSFSGDTVWYYPYDRRETATNGYTQDFEGKIDYAMPVKQDGKFEAGGSARLRTMESGMNQTSYVFALEEPPVDTLILLYKPDYNFIYHENVYALYAQYGSKIGEFSYQAGLRGEIAHTKSDLAGAAGAYEFYFQNNLKPIPTELFWDTIYQDALDPHNYFQLYPTAYLMYQLKEKNELKLNYSRRVNRPGPWNLNPFQDFTDPLNIRMGNPDLKPEYINSLELDFFRYLKAGNTSATLYYRNTTNVISRVTEVDPVSGVSISTWDNLNTNNAYGLELLFNNKFFNMWSLNASANFGYSKISGDLSTLNQSQSINRGSFSWTLRANNSFQVTETTALQFNARYVGPRITAQGEFHGFFAGDVGFRQDFLQKTLSLTLNVRDVFNTMKFSSTSESEYFYQTFSRKPKGCVGYLSLTWKFGNMSIRDAKKRQTPSSEQQQREPDEGLEMF